MRLVQIQRDALLKPLQAVSGVVEKRHTLPILSNVLIRREPDRIIFVATDLEIQVTTTSMKESNGEESVGLTVSARKLQEILRSLPEGSEVMLDLQNNRLQVRAGKSRFNLQTLPAIDFPTLAQPGPVQGALRIPQKQLREILQLVQYSMAQQDIRYYLNGLLLVLEAEQLKVIATDGHRLSYAATKVGTHHEQTEVILPRKAVLELVKLLEDSSDEVEIGVHPGQVRFQFGALELVTKIIDGKFPDYTRVIPTTHAKHITVERAVLLDALQRAATLANEKFRGVRWMLASDTLRVSCTNSEQEEAQEELEVRYSDAPLDIGFNIAYLLDVLASVHGNLVDCAFGDATSSMLITFPDQEDFKYVVMPMRI